MLCNHLGTSIGEFRASKHVLEYTISMMIEYQKHRYAFFKHGHVLLKHSCTIFKHGCASFEFPVIVD